ncbi:CalY family protein [Fictibacillus enclensis]|uniref:CalY family protein n=1 Tax=Fictibacillus enclensis TaxID=1017270 RepID=UPI0024BF6C09|nr:CalY family protein [Fictibacillus enclensis]MDM5339647.1 CalY family protein [Fictibacillus enclensis]WHY71102.1 CalY family protein [Fictibacillus enclensis]
MSLKKKLGLGVASAALGLSLIGGGTYAYFSDSAEASSTFAAGTLDINTDPSTIVDLSNLKPGDYILRSFDLKNDGTLDVKKILLNTDYTVTDAKGDNAGEDFGQHIQVDFLYNSDKDNDVIYSTTLADLKKQKNPDAVAKGWMGEKKGLKAGDSDEMLVMFTFVDNGQDQNKFQGDSLSLKWTFNAQQGAGEAK